MSGDNSITKGKVEGMENRGRYNLLLYGVIIFTAQVHGWDQASFLLDTRFDDAQALSYCADNKNTHIAVLYPAVSWDFEKVRIIFAKYGTLQYAKTMELQGHGPFNILYAAYGHERWIGCIHDNFRGLQVALNKRFLAYTADKLYQIVVLLFQSENLKNVDICKEEIRRLFGNAPRYPIHINDTHLETMILAKAVFQPDAARLINEPQIVQCPSKNNYPDVIPFPCES